MRVRYIHIVKELKYLSFVLLVLVILFKIVFYKGDFLVVVRTVLGLFYMFILPGFFIMYYWQDKLDFLERVIMGFPISAAIIGITSYMLGIFGLHIKYHWILPLIVILLGLVLAIFNKDES